MQNELSKHNEQSSMQSELSQQNEQSSMQSEPYKKRTVINAKRNV